LKKTGVYLFIERRAAVITHSLLRGRRGRNRMVVGFTNTYALSTYQQ
jgi:hypothetical protein